MATTALNLETTVNQINGKSPVHLETDVFGKPTRESFFLKGTVLVVDRSSWRLLTERRHALLTQAVYYY